MHDLATLSDLQERLRLAEATAKLTDAQQDARLAILRDVLRSGGSDVWSHLHSHGHHYKQVQACVRRGDLRQTGAYHYMLTDAGRKAIEHISGTRRVELGDG